MAYPLEILDQLADGSPMKLSALRRIARDPVDYQLAVAGLLAAGEVALSNASGVTMPSWEVQALLRSGELWLQEELHSLALTDLGARRIG